MDAIVFELFVTIGESTQVSETRLGEVTVTVYYPHTALK